MKVGYARVSTTGQSLETQIDCLTRAGCQKIYDEKKSGASRAERLELSNALDFIREGDVLMVTKLDRLARSVLDLTQTANILKDKNVDLVVLDQQIDTASSTWRLLFHMLGAIGEFERDLIKERAAEGIARAKENGVRFGPKRKLTDDEIAALRNEAAEPSSNKTDLANKYGISRATLYRLLNVD